jgi:hypothetical protein
MKRTLIAVLVLALGGCQQMVWFKPGVTADQTRLDEADARLYASNCGNLPLDDIHVSGDSVREVAASVTGSLSLLFIADAINQTHLFNCEMHDKGYQLLTKKKAKRLEAAYRVALLQNAPMS